MINGHKLTLKINKKEYTRIVEEFNSLECVSITGKIKSLFIFIAFLHSNIANFKTYDSVNEEIEELRKEYNSLGPINHYKERLKEDELKEKLSSRGKLIIDKIYLPIRDLAAYLGIYDLSLQTNVWNWSISEIEELHENVIVEDVPIIQKYGQMYTEYREATNNYYGFNQFFKHLDRTLDFLFSFYSDDNATEDVEEPFQLTPLFSFIDFLHINIDNFNQYDSDILELKKMRERFSQLGFHYTEKVERDALQEGINEKWDVIFDNIVSPIKNKVTELDLFDWQAPETLSNNYFHIANTLRKDYKDKDLSAIFKAKNQYIEFTNEISPYIIHQSELIFDYLYEIMAEIAKNFHKKGDMPIKHEEARRVDTFEELVEGFKAGEKVSMPLFPSNLANVNLQPVPNEAQIKAEDTTVDVPETPNDVNTKITPQTKTLFNFIDYLHSSIQNINQNMKVVLEWKKARWEERQFGQHYSEKLKMREVRKVINEKWDEISYQLIEPIKEKAIEIDVCILDNPKTIYTVFSHDIVMLEENFLKSDADEIKKVKKQYIEIRNDINPHIILLLKDFFLNFDELMKHLVAFFYEDGDRTIPRIVDIYLDDYFSTPESFDLPLTDLQIKDFYDSLLIEHQEVICDDTDFDYFSYAISGKEMPLEKTPYKPVILIGTIDNMYYELLNLMKKHGVILQERKTIPQKYVEQAEKLFLNRYGKPLKLRTPK